MLYAIAIGVLAFAVFLLWGIRKMFRMNNDPGQMLLAQLLVSAGNGSDEGLLSFMGEQRWTNLQVMDRVAHALTVVEMLFPGEYLRAKAYASTLEDRYRSYQDGHLRGNGTEPTCDANQLSDPTPTQSAKPNANSVHGDSALAAPTANTAAPQPPRQPGHRFGFEVSEFVVYPAHGVGQILAIEEQEISGAKLEFFVINFMKDKMTLRVPTKKVANVGMRKLSDPETIQKVYLTLAQPRHVAVGNWSRLAQEYETKINSGDIIALAEVMRDLYRPAVNPGQSLSERQLYQAALDRLSREVAVIQHITDEEAIEELESLMIASFAKRS